MNRDEQMGWQDLLLRTLAAAVGASPRLRACIIFKGARVLAKHIPAHSRASFDLDAALHGPTEWTGALLERELTGALQSYLADAEVKPFTLEEVTVTPNPERQHPRGWNGWDIVIAARPIGGTVRNPPKARAEFRAPEPLRVGATCELDFDGESVVAYSLERQLGEKGRAFLLTIAPNSKRPRRVKDLFDLALTLRERPLSTHETLWRTAGLHFLDACTSRDVTFVGIESFARGLGETRRRYTEDPTLGEIGFEDAWSAVEAIVSIWSDVRREYEPLETQCDTR